MKKKIPKPHRTWGILKPATKVIQSKKKYSRAQAKKEAERDFHDL